MPRSGATLALLFLAMPGLAADIRWSVVGESCASVDAVERRLGSPTIAGWPSVLSGESHWYGSLDFAHRYPDSLAYTTRDYDRAEQVVYGCNDGKLIGGVQLFASQDVEAAVATFRAIYDRLHSQNGEPLVNYTAWQLYGGRVQSAVDPLHFIAVWRTRSARLTLHFMRLAGDDPRRLRAALLVSANPVIAPGDADPLVAEMERLSRLEAMARNSQPRPRDGPLRYLNISDEEVGEVEAAVWTVVPGTLLHIGPVVTGCSCQEGRACDDQVWVIAEDRPVPKGVQVSRIGGHWTLGPLQRWWLQYEMLQDSRIRASHYAEFADAERRLLASQPTCENFANGVR